MELTYEYDLIFCDGDEEIVSILDKVNDEIICYDTILDIHDLDDETADCSLDFNLNTCEYDWKVIEIVEDTLKNMGIKYELDKYPFIDDCGTCCSYDIKLLF